MNSIEKLTQIFSQFPGIGPRQARRFVYYLLTRTDNTLEELSQDIKDLKNDVTKCDYCQRFFQSSRRSFSGGEKNGAHCNICSDQNRDHATLMLVQRDIDLESVERNGNFNGIYFILGGSIPILDKEPEKRIRIKELKNFIAFRQVQGEKEKLKEIIIAVNWNPEGENTGNYVKKEIEAFKATTGKLKISHLGKGLSMGTELEYIDSDTLKNALENRN